MGRSLLIRGNNSIIANSIFNNSYSTDGGGSVRIDVIRIL
ncbi:hypothetical protein ALNOE001_03860 [Candidatus Methanobinarius endosymbioticus]|uniref:Uncharacterized protein n=1 Tax=Candidatus Methanobinarius endosymbioticus TaxID=2006182 RepID=A0A366MDD2_9EURY|nr:hypothetical protein ALNOE001_03860 [Candidatus Methanobinarius endosymbioticus]